VSTSANIPFTENEALGTSGGPLPAGMDREKYERTLSNLEADGLEILELWEIKDIERVIKHQKSVKVGVPSQDVKAESNNGDADRSLSTDPKQLEPQAKPQDIGPGKRPGQMKPSLMGLQRPLRANLTMLTDSILLPPTTCRNRNQYHQLRRTLRRTKHHPMIQMEDPTKRKNGSRGLLNGSIGALKTLGNLSRETSQTKLGSSDLINPTQRPGMKSSGTEKLREPTYTKESTGI
jgi:hypothetical protein